MITIWSEWDIGQEDIAFTSMGAANNWLLDNDNLVDCFEEGLSGQEGIDNLVSAGMLGFTGLTVINEKGEYI